LAFAAQLVNSRGAAAWRVALRDHGHTASPNAGWSMAAIAGALDTILTKRDHYTLGDGGRTPDAAMLREARRIARVALGCVVVALAIGAWRKP
jgi:adenosylcobinamide-phosphate synthase